MKSAHIALMILTAFASAAPLLSHAQEYNSNPETKSPLFHYASRLTWGTAIDNQRVQIYIDINPRVQRLHVIIDGVQVPDRTGKLDWKISSGRPGHTSPIGAFSLDNRWVMAHSNKYDNSPMPFVQFVSGGKIGIHGTAAVGHLGSVASHGCIRLHTQNAERLFKLVEAVLIQDCQSAGIDQLSCPLRGIAFQKNPTRNVGVVLYDSSNANTMYGMSPLLPWLTKNNVQRTAPRTVQPPPMTREEIEKGDAEDRAYDEEQHRQTEELNRRTYQQMIRQQNSGTI